VITRCGESSEGVIAGGGTRIGYAGARTQSLFRCPSTAKLDIEMTKPTKSKSGKLGRESAKDGVDRTLIRWMLSLTPEERLRAVQNHANAVRRLRDGGKSE
jgi:hypothetical protein